ncbi:MAG: LysM peptidoglycan-binding domain-containing protein [Planctomycetes bacterium]|nr:LysM peptidoglycan-binding domain-containing protein [Planctomycetota bacterium]
MKEPTDTSSNDKTNRPVVISTDRSPTQTLFTDDTEKQLTTKSIGDLLKDIEKKKENPVETPRKGNTSSEIENTSFQLPQDNPIETTQYVVQSGDSYWTIAKKVLGNGGYWKEVEKLNPDIDTGKLKPGMKIIVPNRASMTRVKKGETDITTAANANNVQLNSNEYIVKRGDTLWKIAKMLDSGKPIKERIEILKKANKGKIINNDVVPGTKLVLK